MKKLLLLVMAFAIGGWAVPKPMESIENYNVLMVHGAYSAKKGFSADTALKSALENAGFLGDATLGGYGNGERITKWLSGKVFEEPDIGDDRNATNSYIYNWRSFSNPANTSLNNAYEMGLRKWNVHNEFGKRRSLFEEAQEVKAVFYNSAMHRNDSGQVALDSMRQYPDLYHQLASRYILVGHSMGGVVSREYVQGNFYNGDVDKILALDSPHEGTGAMNLIVKKSIRFESALNQAIENFYRALPAALVMGTAMISEKGNTFFYKTALITLAFVFGVEELGNFLTWAIPEEIYYYNDPLVHYVNPKQTGFQTIDSLNHLSYENKIDSLPMFRILASRHGMTFSDPDLGHL